MSGMLIGTLLSLILATGTSFSSWMRRFGRFVVTAFQSTSECLPKARQWEELDFRRIESARDRPPQIFRTTVRGVIERELDPNSPAYQALTWKNLYFGNSRRKTVRHAMKSTSHNSPLFRHPEIMGRIEEVHLCSELGGDPETIDRARNTR